MIPSYLSEEMHLRDLHSAHQELCNHGKKNTSELLRRPENSPSLHHLPSPTSKKVKKHRPLSVAIVLYLGICDKYKHISSHSDVSSLFIVVNFLWWNM